MMFYNEYECVSMGQNGSDWIRIDGNGLGWIRLGYVRMDQCGLE